MVSAFMQMLGFIGSVIAIQEAYSKHTHHHILMFASVLVAAWFIQAIKQTVSAFSGVMPSELHHVSIVVSNVQRARQFYETLLMTKPIPRNAYSFGGEWFKLPCGRELHLVEGMPGRVYPNPVDTNFANFARNKKSYEEQMEIVIRSNCHFALSVPDLGGTLERLAMSKIKTYPVPLVSFRQEYCFDPDGNMIEIHQLSSRVWSNIKTIYRNVSK